MEGRKACGFQAALRGLALALQQLEFQELQQVGQVICAVGRGPLGHLLALKSRSSAGEAPSGDGATTRQTLTPAVSSCSFQDGVGGKVGDFDGVGLQVRVTVEGEQGRRALGSLVKDAGDRVRSLSPHGKGSLHRAGECSYRCAFQEPKHLYVLAGPEISEVRFQPPAKKRETVGQFPFLQGLGEVEGSGFSLEKCQVVAWIEGDPLLVPAPRMDGTAPTPVDS